MPSRRRVLTGMRGEQPGGPQLVGITQLLRLSARQRHQPGFRLGGDNRIASCPRPIIQRLDYAQFRRSLQTACHRLLRHSNRARHCISRRVVQIGQDNPRPFDTARGLGSRPSNLQQTSPLFGISRQRDHSTRCYHWTPSPIPAPHTTYRQKEKSIRNILIFRNLYTRLCPVIRTGVPSGAVIRKLSRLVVPSRIPKTCLRPIAVPKAICAVLLALGTN